MDTIRNSWIFGILMIAWLVISVMLTGLVIILAAPFLGGKRAFFAIAPLWARQIFWLRGIQLEVEGWDDLPEDIRQQKRSVVFMSNHESNLDPPVLFSAIPIPAVYLSKKELLWAPFVGWAAALGGTIFIDRSNRERAIQSLHRAAEEIRGGKNVVIFPEGTRTRTGELGPFKKGGFALALDAGVSIVPLATVGGFKILPAKSLFLKSGRYRIVFGEPVDPTQFENRDELIKEVRHRISALIARTNA